MKTARLLLVATSLLLVANGVSAAKPPDPCKGKPVLTWDQAGNWSRTARIVPEIREGKAHGFRVYSLQPDSPLARIGVQNGDIVTKAAGLEITSPETALEIYARMQKQTCTTLTIKRNGQELELAFRLK